MESTLKKSELLILQNLYNIKVKGNVCSRMTAQGINDAAANAAACYMGSAYDCYG